MLATDTAAARPARFDRASQHRRAMLAKVQIARQQLQIDEDDYRQILLDETGQLSCRDLDEHGLAKVLQRMERLGFKAMPRAGARQPAQHPMARKARALWISLHHLGVVRNPSEEALEAFAKRQLGCEKLVWARQSDAYKLIEALKALAERYGWSHAGQPTPVKLQERLCEAILTRMKATGRAPKDWGLETAAFRVSGIRLSGDEPVTAEQYARAAKALGAKLRETLKPGLRKDFRL